MLKKFRRGETWYVRGTVRGVRVYETTGTADAARAEEFRARREAQLWDRAVVGERGTHTFAEAAVIYLQARHPGPHFRQFTLRPLGEYFGDWPVDKITQAALDTYIGRHHARSAPGTIVRAVITPMTAVLRVAAKRKWCDMPAFERPRVAKVTTRWLTHEEAARLLEACAPHLRPLVTFLLHTGARLGEALHLEWSDVDLSGRRVRFLDTKNGESRGVPLNDDAFFALANMPHRDGRVFLTPAGTPYHDTRGLGGSPIKRAFNSACVRAGLAEITGYRVDKRGRRWPIIDTTVTPHKLRHTFASWLVMKGVPLRTVAELLGHKSLAMVHRYSHLSPDHLRGSVDLLSTGAKSVQAAGKTS
jgi:integrase